MSHRRNPSVNSSSETISRPTTQTYLAPIETLTLEKSHLDNVLNDNNTTPSTPSKNKTHNPFFLKKPRKIDAGSPQSSTFDLRNMFFMLIFCGALVIFLGALSGLGLPFDDDIINVNIVVSNEDGQIETTNDLDNNNNNIDENEFPGFAEFSDENFETQIDEKIELPESAKEVEFDEIVKPEVFDKVEVDQNSEFPIENEIEIEMNPEPTGINEKVEEKNVENENLGHSNEIFSNNDDDASANENKLEQTDNEIILEGLPNKLKDSHRVTIPSEIQNQSYDYSNYKYIRNKSHFTYDDVVESLTDEEREIIHKTQILEMNTDESLESSCGSWQDNYSKLHERILSGNEAQRYVSYICDDKSNCGGLSDRILGMTSAFVFALLTNRAFLADWQTPFPLDTIFNSPNLNWSHDSLNPSSDIQQLETSELNVIDFDARNLDQQFMLSNWTTKYPSPFIKFYSNRGMIIRSFDSKYYSQLLKEMGLRPHTTFGCILDYLFRPVPSALSFITQYTSLFALPGVFTVGIQIDTRNRNELTSLQDYERYFNCADQLTQTYAAPFQKVIYYLVTDSSKLRNEAVQKFEHVVVSGLPVESDLDELGNPDNTNNAIIESWIFSRTDYRIISPGDYGKLAAFYSKQLHTTISVEHLYSDNQDLDCTKEDAFITFSKLASESSLG